jgi:hemolysin III
MEAIRPESIPHSAGLTAEIANSVTHGLGAVMGVTALVFMVVQASLYGSARHIVGAAIFGSALVLLYTMSTLYHALRGPRVKKVFKILDHSAIYVLIAGTYTPFCLATLRGPWGSSLLWVIWGLCLLGIIFKALFTGRFGILSTFIYLGMGWLVMAAARPLWLHLARPGMYWLMLGGLFYTLGTVFYSWRNLRFHHAIWHLFVLAGSLSHVAAILGYVIPGRP